MPNRSHLVWIRSSVDLFIAATATLVSLQFQNAQATRMSLAEILAVRLTPKNFLLLTLFLILWTGVHQLFGLYMETKRNRRALCLSAVAAASLGSAFYLLFPMFSHEPQQRIFAPVLIFFAVAALLSICVRISVWPQIATRRRVLNTLIIGSGPIALRSSESMATDRRINYHILGFLDTPSVHVVPDKIKRHLLGTFDQLEALLASTHVDEVLIALPLRSCYDKIQQSIAICERVGVPVTYRFQPFMHNIGYSQVLERALEPYISHRPSRVEQAAVLKRTMDIILSASTLLVLSPLFLVIALAIRLNSRGPAFFVQERYGRNRQRFRMWKFRSMVSDAEARQQGLETQNEAQGPVFKIKNDPRITSLGRFLRKTSLDELPQLLNVLRGEMSLVGPRPLPLRDVHKFSQSSLMRRFSVKPGLTCLWQVNGRSNTNFEQWIAYDLEYIDTWSTLTDLKILLLTIPAVFRGSGAV